MSGESDLRSSLSFESIDPNSIWAGMAGSMVALIMATILSMHKLSTKDSAVCDRALDNLLNKFSRDASGFVSTVSQFCQAAKSPRKMFPDTTSLDLQRPQVILTCVPHRESATVSQQTVLTCVGLDETEDYEAEQSVVHKLEDKTTQVSLTSLENQFTAPEPVTYSDFGMQACECESEEELETVHVPEMTIPEPRPEMELLETIEKPVEINEERLEEDTFQPDFKGEEVQEVIEPEKEVIDEIEVGSSIAEPESTIEVEQPSFEVEEPSVQMEKPSVEVEESIKVKKSSVEVKEPTIEVKDTTIEVKEPTIEVKEPTIEVKEPTIEVEEPSIVVKEPTPEIEEPPPLNKEELPPKPTTPASPKESVRPSPKGSAPSSPRSTPPLSPKGSRPRLKKNSDASMTSQGKGRPSPNASERKPSSPKTKLERYSSDLSEEAVPKHCYCKPKELSRITITSSGSSKSSNGSRKMSKAASPPGSFLRRPSEEVAKGEPARMKRGGREGRRSKARTGDRASIEERRKLEKALKRSLDEVPFDYAPGQRCACKQRLQRKKESERNMNNNWAERLSLTEKTLQTLRERISEMSRVMLKSKADDGRMSDGESPPLCVCSAVQQSVKKEQDKFKSPMAVIQSMLNPSEVRTGRERQSPGGVGGGPVTCHPLCSKLGLNHHRCHHAQNQKSSQQLKTHANFSNASQPFVAREAVTTTPSHFLRENCELNRIRHQHLHANHCKCGPAYRK